MINQAINLGEAVGLWIVILGGVAACMIGLYFLYMYLFDLLARWLKFHLLFKNFIYDRYSKNER